MEGKGGDRWRGVRAWARMKHPRFKSSPHCRRVNDEDECGAREHRGTAVPAVGTAGILPALRDNAGGTPASPAGRMTKSPGHPGAPGGKRGAPISESAAPATAQRRSKNATPPTTGAPHFMQRCRLRTSALPAAASTNNHAVPAPATVRHRICPANGCISERRERSCWVRTSQTAA